VHIYLHKKLSVPVLHKFNHCAVCCITQLHYTVMNNNMHYALVSPALPFNEVLHTILQYNESNAIIH